jgi:glycerol 3-phosphatase-2
MTPAGTVQFEAGLRGCARPLVDVYDAALLDLDGVVYVGRHAVPHAAEVLEAARGRGMHLAFVTNNAARTPGTVAAHLTELGIPARADEVATSAQAAARLVAELVPPGCAVLVVGGEGLDEALREHGLYPVRSLEQDPKAVVQGYHPTVDWEQLAEGAYAVARGLPWVASNMDLTIPTARGIAPGNGTLVAAIQAATGVRPLVAGKPELPLHREATERAGARRPLVVGDRLDTDIEGAVRAGTDSLLVFTGVTTPSLLLLAGPEARPSYLAPDLRGLLEPAPSLQEARPGEWRCGGWTSRVDGGELVVGGEGDPYDGLRAACRAAWANPQPPVVAAAVRQLGW